MQKLKKKSKQLLSLLFTFATVFLLFAAMTLTASAAITDPVTINITPNTGNIGNGNSDANNSGVNQSQWSYNGTEKILELLTTGGNYTLTGTNNNLYIRAPYTMSVTLNNVNVTSASSSPALSFESGGTITIVGTNKLSASGASASGLRLGGTIATTITSGAGSSLSATSVNRDGINISGPGGLIITGHADVTATGSLSGIRNDSSSTYRITVGENAKLAATGGEDGFFGYNNPLTLEVDGAASFKTTATGKGYGGISITGNGTLAIRGKGTVSTEAKESGIVVASLYIYGCNVTAKGTTRRAVILQSGGKITMNDAAVLTMTNGSGAAEQHTFAVEGTDWNKPTDRVWKLTNAVFIDDTFYSVTDREIEVRVAAGQTGTVAREPKSGKLGDVNNDGKVDATDLSLLISDFGLKGKNLRSDLNNDDVVDGRDLAILLKYFGS